MHPLGVVPETVVDCWESIIVLKNISLFFEVDWSTLSSTGRLYLVFFEVDWSILSSIGLVGAR